MRSRHDTDLPGVLTFFEPPLSLWHLGVVGEDAAADGGGGKTVRSRDVVVWAGLVTIRYVPLFRDGFLRKSPGKTRRGSRGRGIGAGAPLTCWRDGRCDSGGGVAAQACSAAERRHGPTGPWSSQALG